MIERSKMKQVSDFRVEKDTIIHRNPIVPQIRYFDDTFVSLFEIAISLEIQNAFKKKDISSLRLVSVLHSPERVSDAAVSLIRTRGAGSRQQVHHRQCGAVEGVLSAWHSHAC